MHHTQAGLRQVTGVKVLQVFHLLLQQAGPAACRFALQIGRPTAGQGIQQLLAHGAAHRSATGKGALFAQQGTQRPSCYHGQQEGQGMPDLGLLECRADHAVQQGGQQVGLSDEQGSGDGATEDGKCWPAPSQSAALPEPVHEDSLALSVHDVLQQKKFRANLSFPCSYGNP